MSSATSHLLSGSELKANEILHLLELATELKAQRYAYTTVLQHKHLALMFDKPSLRTRMSFVVAMRELGGDVIESESTTRKSEEPEDQVRVLQRYCHAIMVRTHDHDVLTRMQTVATIPVINGLSELYHPCQTLADLLTIQEKFGSLKGQSICYIGDGNNVLHSLLLMAPKLGINVHYSCPKDYGPNPAILQKALSDMGEGAIISYQNPRDAVKKCDAVYTDVWTSMGFPQKDEDIFTEFQVNEDLMKKANKHAIFMHCMPMNRGKEVSESLPDQSCSVIFQQSENRLHVQKALLYQLLH